MLRSKIKCKQLFYLQLNRNNNNGIVSTYFLDRFARSIYTINVKNWLPRVVSMVSIYSNQLGRLAPATDQYPLDEWYINIGPCL